ncbi:MAG: bZIP transcription factor [Armatimonadota bacterium]
MSVANPNYRTIGMLVVGSLGAFVCLGGFTTWTARAQTDVTVQAPDSAALQRKVEALEKQVELLQKQVEDLKKWRNVAAFTQQTPPLPSTEVLPGTPFQFNGRTYYGMLLKGNAAPALDRTKLGNGLISPAQNPYTATLLTGSK